MKTQLILIRHGESFGNSLHLFCGRTDVALTPLGLQQAEATGEYLKDTPLDAIFASPLSRAMETAKAVNRHHNLPIQKEEGLLEIWGGEWENKSFQEIMELYPADRSMWNENIGRCRCTGGESVLEVQERAYQCLTRLAEENKGKRICLVAHAMLFRSFVSKVLGLSPDEIKDQPWPTNASVTYVDYEDGVFTLKEFSHDAHLKDMVTALPTKM
jgi:broad specificity phosphatase PhoE